MAEARHGTGPMYVYETPGKKAYCFCGWSEKLPYCDGAHTRLATGCLPIKIELTESGEKWVCQCHQTRTPPWCDGTHGTLAAAPDGS